MNIEWVEKSATRYKDSYTVYVINIVVDGEVYKEHQGEVDLDDQPLIRPVDYSIQLADNLANKKDVLIKWIEGIKKEVELKITKGLCEDCASIGSILDDVQI